MSYYQPQIDKKPIILMSRSTTNSRKYGRQSTLPSKAAGTDPAKLNHVKYPPSAAIREAHFSEELAQTEPDGAT